MNPRELAEWVVSDRERVIWLALVLGAVGFLGLAALGALVVYLNPAYSGPDGVFYGIAFGANPNLIAYPTHLPFRFNGNVCGFSVYISNTQTVIGYGCSVR